MWQDYALTIIQIALCITLIPLLFAKEKPPLLSSVTTTIALIAGGSIFLTLHLWLAGFSQIIVGLQWLVLAVQKIRQPKP